MMSNVECREKERDEMLLKMEPIIKEVEAIKTEDEWDWWRDANPEKLELMADAVCFYITDNIREATSQ